MSKEKTINSISGYQLPYWSNIHPFETIRLELDYSYLGNRSYIQGIVGLDGMLRALDHMDTHLFDGSARIKVAKINKEIVSYTLAEALFKKDIRSHPYLGSELARVDVEIAGNSLVGLLFSKDHEPIKGRNICDNSGGHITCLEHVNNDDTVGLISKIKTYIDLIRAIEEVQRDSIITLVGNKISKVRWAFIENLPILTDNESSKITEVFYEDRRVFPHNRGFFDYRKGSLNGKHCFTICFYFEFSQEIAQQRWLK